MQEKARVDMLCELSDDIGGLKAAVYELGAATEQARARCQNGSSTVHAGRDGQHRRPAVFVLG
jgi:hypothetical protein